MDNLLRKVWEWIKERKTFLIMVTILYILFVIVLGILWGNRTPISNVAIPWDWLWLATVIGYTLASLQTIKQDKQEQGVKTLFGKVLYNHAPGLAFVPLGICNLIRLPTTVNVLLIGQARERPIERNEEGRIVKFDRPAPPEGTLVDDAPVRITSSSYEAAVWKEKEKSSGTMCDLTNEERNHRFPKEEDFMARRGTFDPQIVVGFVIKDGGLFLKMVGQDVKMAIPRLSQATRATLQEYCGRRALSFIIYHLEDEATTHLRYALEKLTGDTDAKKRAEVAKESTTDWKESWGIDIHYVRITDAGLPFRLNEALAEARAEGALKDKRITAAEAKKRELELEAQGKRANEREVLLGRMEGYEKLIGLGLTPEQVLAADTGRAVAENVGNLLVTDGSVLANTIGAVAAGKAVLTGQPVPRQPKKRRSKTGTDSTSPASSSLPSPPPANP